jgi:dTDP-glucose 4,6-dehydratase
VRSATAASSPARSGGSLRLGLAALLGGTTGAVLLLVLPEKAFKAIVPVFIAIALVLILLQPRISAHLAQRREEPVEHRRVSSVATYLTGIYGGYFGAAQGIMLLAVLGVALPEPLQRVNGLKNVLAGLVNLIAGVVFVLPGPGGVGARAADRGRLDAGRGARRPLRPPSLTRRAARTDRRGRPGGDRPTPVLTEFRRYAATAMATCLVTGGAGFLGSHLCDELLRRGHRVVCVDSVETGSLANVQHIRAPEFRFVLADIIQPFHIDEPVDVVYHFASPASPIDYLRLPLHTLKVGSLRHAPHARPGQAHRARFLLASTSEVYGDPKVHPQPESYWGHVNPIGPRGVYDEAKRYAEALTMAYHRQQGVDTAIVRIFNTYGPRMRPHDGRAIPTFLRQALQDRPITVFGDGSQTRSFCYVSDLVDGIIRLAESGYHHPVNVGTRTSSRCWSSPRPWWR